MTTMRSRLRTATSGEPSAIAGIAGHGALTHGSVRGQMQHREMGMAARPLERHGVVHPGHAVAVLRLSVLEAVRQGDARPVGAFVTGLRIGSALASTTPGTEKWPTRRCDVRREKDRL